MTVTSPLPDRWRAMTLSDVGRPLQAVWREGRPQPGPGEVLIRVAACGVCRTDLHIVDGELAMPAHAVVPGHEIVGRVVALGPAADAGHGVAPGATVEGGGATAAASRGVTPAAPATAATPLAVGMRVGVPWLGWTCGACEHCRAGRENLCDQARFTGWQIAGGYADYAVADARYVFPLPDGYTDAEAAPLLCAGLIGWRALAMAGDAKRLGIYGFGAAAHLIAQVALRQGREVFAFTRPGDTMAQDFARSLGVTWAGGSDELPPAANPAAASMPPGWASSLGGHAELDAALLFAPVGALVPAALKAVRKGGTVVCAGIHMTDIPSFPYGWLWGERHIVSVANLTRRDGEDFLRFAGEHRLEVSAVPYALERVNEALDDLRAGRLSGAAVLLP